jgi:rubredoxin
MSERALRGTRLGATSYETDSNIEFAARQEVAYSCPNGHVFAMPFAAEADVPSTWECKVCGQQALLVDGQQPEEKQTKPQRTHWDMLMERRSRAQLEEVLAERLALLRAGELTRSSIAPRNAPVRTMTKRATKRAPSGNQTRPRKSA